ncbi:hypothetical protein SDJN02_23018, partial [Cucurbita argyrosperma subsp. argyrosperma]
MSVSLEALAMAGITSNEWAMDAEEWERNEIENDVPPHLLADEDDDDDNVTSTVSNYSFPVAGFFDSLHREDGGADDIHCFWGILCSLSKSLEKRASNGMSSVRIIVRTILGFLLVKILKIISAHTSNMIIP